MPRVLGTSWRGREVLIRSESTGLYQRMRLPTSPAFVDATTTGRLRLPGRRPNCAPRDNHAVVPSGRSQASRPFLPISEHRTHPNVCGGPNTNLETLVKRPIISSSGHSLAHSAATSM